MYKALLHYFDLPILHAINGLCGHSWIADRVISHLALDFKFSIPLCIVGALWFQPAKDDKEQLMNRQRLLVVILAALLALVINRTISVMFPYRVRPMETSGIGYHMPLFESGFNYSDFERWSSFPSDQTTYFFAFTAGFWYFSRKLGLALAAYSTFIALARVYLGTHFPSDVLVGAVLGVVTEVVINCEFARRAMAPVVGWARTQPRYFYAGLFLVVIEMGSGFMNVRDVGRSVLHVLTKGGAA